MRLKNTAVLPILLLFPLLVRADQVPASDDCLCLHNPVNDNVVRNCAQQQRQNDPQPRFFCADAEGVMVQNSAQGWTVLPADHANCAPCKDSRPSGLGPIIPRGD